ncbi:Alkaline phosphatase D precursor [Rubripirellula lacrimiformis]|uniref:Alkaline phosphatase D n=1 Tax=Rubripirellula lacrimiformis TaxID=1930273 RepID=A0A517N5D7_9BACT|nr:alkaline phosphatase D family protein [Rubripirellula lacrimiformis]QDT02359.1 Alkaline phosphatase D precursor [Rubripirellula lacrimiformis]
MSRIPSDDSVSRSAWNRRRFLAFTGALPSFALASQQASAESKIAFSSDPFTLGVASGEPDHRGMVLWTRLAPAPLEPDGGMPNRGVDVTWEVASDDSMRNIVASGTQLATPQLGHSVHVELDQLEPDRWYWYRFRCGDAESPIGRTRTMPLPNTLPGSVKFAVTSCQNYEQGLFTAYQQMADDNVDLVFHLGDYIYEYEAGRNGKVRTHQGNEIMTLADYRIRHAQYRSDSLLQNMHAQCPWVVTWDDHEFDNNCAGDICQDTWVESNDFLSRRANAYQAYYEMMPLRRRQIPRGSDMRLYRSSRFGRLAEFSVLDTRQYRSDQPNEDRKSPLNAAALDPTQTMLGIKQRGWLSRNLIRSTATWNVLAQQVMMGMVNRAGDPDDPQYSMDQWPGYSHERMELMKYIRDRRVSNPVVLTGDIHTNWANELRVDDRQEDQDIVATEFVATSLSSGGNGVDQPKNLDAMLAENPCVRWHNAERGYIRCEVTPDAWKSDYMVVDDVLKPGGKTFQRKSFVVESGNPRLNVS